MNAIDSKAVPTRRRWRCCALAFAVFMALGASLVGVIVYLRDHHVWFRAYGDDRLYFPGFNDFSESGGFDLAPLEKTLREEIKSQIWLSDLSESDRAIAARFVGIEVDEDTGKCRFGLRTRLPDLADTPLEAEQRIRVEIENSVWHLKEFLILEILHQKLDDSSFDRKWPQVISRLGVDTADRKPARMLELLKALEKREDPSILAALRARRGSLWSSFLARRP